MNQSTNNDLQGIGGQFDDTELLSSTSSQDQGSVQYKPTLKQPHADERHEQQIHQHHNDP
jgi:hypothetical protein